MPGIWSKFFNVYPREKPWVIRLGLLFFGLFLAVALLRNFSDTAFIKRYGVQEMPLMLLINGALTFLCLGWLDRLARRLGDARLLAWFLICYAVAAVILFVLIRQATTISVYAILFQLQYLQDSVLLVYLWNLASNLYDARQGRRLFPLFTGAQLGGTILGNFLTHPLQTLWSPDAILPVFAVIWTILGLCLFRWAAKASRAGVALAADAPRPSWKDLAGLAKEFPFVRYLLVMGFLPNALLPIFTYQFSVISNQAFTSEAQLISFLGIFRGLTAVGITFLLLFANRIYGRLGLAMASLLQPLSFVLVFAGLGLFFSLYMAAAGQLAIRLVQQAIAGPVGKVLFNLVPGHLVSWCRVFVRGTVVKAGVLAGSGLMLVLADLPARWLSVVGLIIAVYWLREAWLFRYRFASGLRQTVERDQPDYNQLQPAALIMQADEYLNLASGPEGAAAVQEEPPPTPAEALIQLDDPEPEARARAALVLARYPEVRAVHRLVILLHEQESVRRAAMEALVAAGPSAAPYLHAVLVTSPPRVQRSILDVLRRAGLGAFDLLPFVGGLALNAFDQLAALVFLGRGAKTPGLELLARHLEEAHQETLALIFQTLWVNHSDMRLVYSSLRSTQASAAVELLESVLSPEISRYLVPIIDALPVAEKVARGRRLLPVQRFSDLAELLSHLSQKPSPLTRLLAAYAMGDQPQPAYLPAAAALLFDESREVRLVATYAVQRCTGRPSSQPELIALMEQLRLLPIFSNLSLGELQAIAQVGQRQAFAPGQVLFSAQQTAPNFQIVLAGTAGLWSRWGLADQVRVAQLGTGDILGAVAVFMAEPSPLTGVAESSGEVLAIQASHLEEIMMVYPQLAINLCRYLASRARQAGAVQT
jgi:HEAT repeat protein